MKKSMILNEISNAEFIYLRVYEDASNDQHSHLDYIQNSKLTKIRQVTPLDAKNYEDKLPDSVALLAKRVVEKGIVFDAIFSPISSRKFLNPFKEEILHRCSAPDISERFHRDNAEVKASDPNVSEVELHDNITYFPQGDEARLSKVLMVDDCISRSVTASAYLAHLVRAGAIKDNLEFVAAAPLHIPDTKQRGESEMDIIRKVLRSDG